MGRIICTAVPFEQKHALTKRAKAADSSVAAILRALVHVAPPANRLPTPTTPGKVMVSMSIQDEAPLRCVDEKRLDLARGAYLRRVIEWGLNQ